MGKHAYIVLAHNNFKQLAILLSLLDDTRNDIYLHIDMDVKDVPWQDLKNKVALSKLFLIERIKVKWGDFSIGNAIIQGLKHVINSDIKYSYIHLLSGADLPLHSQDYIHLFFDQFEDNKVNFINAYTPDDLPIEWRERCSLYQILTGEYRNKFKGIRVFSKTINRISCSIQRILHVDRVSKYIRKKNYQELALSGGGTWWSITLEFANYVISQEAIISDLFQNNTLCADELFMQTILMSSSYKTTQYKNPYGPSNLRLIDWEKGKPYTWRKEDYTVLVNSQCLFARKFDENIDHDIIFMICHAIDSESEKYRNE